MPSQSPAEEPADAQKDHVADHIVDDEDVVLEDPSARGKISAGRFGAADRQRARSFNVGARQSPLPTSLVMLGGINQAVDTSVPELKRSNSMPDKPRTKNTLNEWVDVPSSKKLLSTKERYRRRSVSISGAPTAAPVTAAANPERELKKIKFTPAPPLHVLTPEEREVARKQVCAVLLRHWLFAGFSEAQLHAVVKAMRHQTIAEGKAVAKEGEPTGKFFVVTRGGFNMAVQKKSGAEVLVAQVGPSGSFGSKALMGNAESRATCAAAVDSEVFGLTRDVFVAIKQDRGDETTLKTRLEALQRVPAFAQLPPRTLSRLATAAREVLLQPDTDVCDPQCEQNVGDNWLLLLTAGKLAVTRKVGEAAPPSQGALMRRFELAEGEGEGAPLELCAGDTLAAGRGGEEQLIAALHVLSAQGAAAANAAVGAAARPPAATRLPLLRLLGGEPRRFGALVAGGGAAKALRVPMREVAALLHAVPAIMAHPLGVRGLLQCHPLFEDLPCKQLDELGFVASPRAFVPGQRLQRQGTSAEAVHFVLSGTVGLSLRLTEDHPRLARLRTANGPALPADADVVQCGTCEAGGVVGHRSVLRADSEAETVTAIATADTLTLALDRASARKLLPAGVVAALSRRCDESFLWAADARIAVADVTVERIIASGSFGTVALLTHGATGVRFAAKKIPRDAIAEGGLRTQLLIERAVLAQTCHPFICALRSTLRQPQALFLFMELCDGPNVYEVLEEHGPMEEGHALLYAACIIAALGELHASCWAFRDLKAENVVFVSSGAIKLVDFGLAKRAAAEAALYTVCGSIEYMAPEVMSSAGHGRSCDWWSLGCLLYEMVVGHTPWMLDPETRTPTFHVADSELSRRIVSANNPLQFPDGCEASESVKALLGALLVRAPEARLGGTNSGTGGISRHAAFSHLDFGALEAGTVPFPSMPTTEAHSAASAAGAKKTDRSKSGLDPLSQALLDHRRDSVEVETATAAQPAEPPAATPKWGWDDEESRRENSVDEDSVEFFFSESLEERSLGTDEGEMEWDRYF